MAKLFLQPRLRGAPIQHYRFRRNLKDRRRLVHAQPRKKAQIDHFTLAWVEF